MSIDASLPQDARALQAFLRVEALIVRREDARIADAIGVVPPQHAKAIRAFNALRNKLAHEDEANRRAA